MDFETYVCINIYIYVIIYNTNMAYSIWSIYIV